MGDDPGLSKSGTGSLQAGSCLCRRINQGYDLLAI
jgi:hypothetical protein